jgi:hypothetical protein
MVTPPREQALERPAPPAPPARPTVVTAAPVAALPVPPPASLPTARCGFFVLWSFSCVFFVRCLSLTAVWRAHTALSPCTHATTALNKQALQGGGAYLAVKH